MSRVERQRPYDLVKEFAIALGAVTALSVLPAVLFSSPDVRPVTLAQWAKAAPDDFVATAAAELAGTSDTAGYGPPYNHTPGGAQKLGPVSPQNWGGVSEPIDTANDFVIGPLSATPADPALQRALTAWRNEPAGQRQKQAAAYADALAGAPGGDPARVAPGDYGPTPVLTARLLEVAQKGGLDGALLSRRGFYQTDYTRPLLFLADGSYLEDQARARHLAGDQWGMMNETGNYPGQAWLWLYTFWYQIDPFASSGNADALVWGLMAVLTLVLFLLPLIPGLRSIPRWTGVYRLIWRDHYRRLGKDS